MALFSSTPFISAAGLTLLWKAECKALTLADWDCLAQLVSSRVEFDKVEGVPTGGLVFADALRPYANGTGLLIVDDVLTTGISMEKHRDGRKAQGVVLFRRRPCLTWVHPIWMLGCMFRDIGMP